MEPVQSNNNTVMDKFLALLQKHGQIQERNPNCSTKSKENVKKPCTSICYDNQRQNHIPNQTNERNHGRKRKAPPRIMENYKCMKETKKKSLSKKMKSSVITLVEEKPCINQTDVPK